MHSIVQITTSIDSQEAAQGIATALVEQRLAACVQVVGPITSTYRWQEAVESGAEWLAVIKTTDSQIEKVREAIRLIHTYEIPEIIVTPIVAGYEPYLDWVARSVESE
jgi:periplasmic divalent cation tolerance protein